MPFFDIFEITLRKSDTFEHKVKKLSDADGYIDLLWKETILIEMKCHGRNLTKAFIQAIEAELLKLKPRNSKSHIVHL